MRIPAIDGTTYSDLMMYKNVMLVTAGIFIGVVSFSLLVALSLVKNKSINSDEQLTIATLIKVQDVNKQQKLVLNIQTFRQAFYYLYHGIWFSLNVRRKKILLRNNPKETLFFIIIMIFFIIIIWIAFYSSSNINLFHDIHKLFPNMDIE